MTYTEAEEYIKKTHDKEIRLGLDRIAALLDKLGNPQNSLKFIHVAGTNGKGSVCMMTAEILQRAGYKTGLFTSPVISDYREQFRINGEMIPEEDFIRLTQVVKSGCDLLADPPSEFEKATALAFLYFKESFCDFVVLEVGMGGKDDATNVIGTPEVAAIVTIDYDHMGFLGKTLTQIAEKKAGIIKEAGHVVIAEQDEAVMRVLKERCLEKKALISMTSVSDIKMTGSSLAGQSFDYKTYQGVRLSLLGSHQCENAAVVLEIIDCLLAKGYNIKKSAVYEGLRNVHWPGWFEVISQDPLFILDGAHNPNGINALSRNLREYFPEKKFVFLVDLTIFETGGLYQKLIAANKMTDYHLDLFLHGFVMIFFDEILRLLQEKGHSLFICRCDFFLIQQRIKIFHIPGIQEKVSIDLRTDIIDRARVDTA